MVVLYVKETSNTKKTKTSQTVSTYRLNARYFRVVSLDSIFVQTYLNEKSFFELVIRLLY